MKLAWLSLALALAAGAPETRAHSHYPWECCSSTDCWPMGPDSDAKEPDPTMEPGGYVTFDGIFVPHDETRPSPDGRFHICRRGGAATGGIIQPDQRPICMWAPRPSS